MLRPIILGVISNSSNSMAAVGFIVGAFALVARPVMLRPTNGVAMTSRPVMDAAASPFSRRAALLGLAPIAVSTFAPMAADAAPPKLSERDKTMAKAKADAEKKQAALKKKQAAAKAAKEQAKTKTVAKKAKTVVAKSKKQKVAVMKEKNKVAKIKTKKAQRKQTSKKKKSGGGGLGFLGNLFALGAVGVGGLLLLPSDSAPAAAGDEPLDVDAVTAKA